MPPDPSEFSTYFSSHTPTKWLPRLSLNMCKPGTSQVSQSWLTSMTMKHKQPSCYSNDGVFLSCRGNGQRPSRLQRHFSKFPAWFVFLYFIFSWMLINPWKSRNFAPSENCPLYSIKLEQLHLDRWKESEQCKHLYGTLLSSQFFFFF